MRLYLLLWIFSVSTLMSTGAYAGAGKVLSFKEIIKLHKKDRHKYLKVLAKALIKLDPESREVSLMEVLGFYTEAYAEESFRCIGGGVPVKGVAGDNCGVSSYAGFECKGADAGKEICNPFIFGVKGPDNPLCMSNATTKKCFDKAKVSKNTFTDPVFNKPGAKEKYEEFRTEIEKICVEKTANIAESDYERDKACKLVERQTTYNRDKLKLAGFVDDAPAPVVTDPTLREPGIAFSRPEGAPRLAFRDEDGDELGGGEALRTDMIYRASTDDLSMAAVDGVSIQPSYFKNSGQYNEFATKLTELLEKNPELRGSKKALEHALAFFYKHKDGGVNSCGGDPEASSSLRNQDWINVTDYTRPNTQKRMFYINMKTGDVVSSPAAHGSGSGRGSMPTNIGDERNSNKTSGGFFETRQVYTSRKCVSKRSDGSCRRSIIRPTFGGQSDNSIKLRGLLPSNDNAFVRGVVHHGATYVSSSSAGLSWGCPAPNLQTFRQMRYEIDQGALMYLHTVEQDKLSEPEC